MIANKLSIIICISFVFLMLSASFAFAEFVYDQCPENIDTPNELRNQLRIVVLNFLAGPSSSSYALNDILDLLDFYKSVKDQSLIADCSASGARTGTLITAILEKTLVFKGQCNDEVDNDKDSFIDLADDGCDDVRDKDERNQCADGIDNDNDALVDLSDDGCDDAQDNDEINPVVIFDVNPSSGKDTGGISVTINGDYFVDGTGFKVRFNDVIAAVNSVTKTAVSAIIPASVVLGPVDVKVTNADSGSYTLNNGFTYISTPTITGVSPSNGVSIGGTNIKITGSDFIASPLPTVTIGGKPAIVSSADNSVIAAITPITPFGVVGPADVAVINADSGSYTLSNGFTYTPFGFVFVTSAVYSGNLGGLSGADAKCQNLANNAGLIGVWKAWLSIWNSNARNRITDQAYINPRGELVANNLADLTDGSIERPINIDEKGSKIYYGVVWTGTKSDGTYNYKYYYDDIRSCLSWSSSSSNAQSTVGLTDSKDKLWTDNSFNAASFMYCVYPARLYCFEQTSDVLREPTITSISPSSGTTSGGTSITVKGTRFLVTPTITIDGNPATNVAFIDTTTVTAKTPPGTLGAKQLVLTNPDGQSASGIFTYN